MSKVHELIEQAYEAEDHAQAYQLLQEAVRQADLSGDEDAGYDARDALLDAAHEVGDNAAILTTFGWLLNYADQHPEEEKEEELFWRYKWVLAICRSLPSVPLERIHALQADFARRTRAAGLGERTANMERWRLALNLGDLEAAEEWRQKVTATPASWLDCAACDTDLLVHHLLKRGELDEALKVAQSVFNWKESCNRVPASTYAQFALPLLQAGRAAEAQTHYERGYNLVRGEHDALREQAEHLLYLVKSGQTEAAERTYAANLPFAQANRTPSHLLQWHTAAAALGKAGEYEKARDIAAAFDKRGGTQAYTQELARLLN